MDHRLLRWQDADGQVWQVCQICTVPTREQDLALDPADGLYWDVCAECKRKEEREQGQCKTTD